MQTGDTLRGTTRLVFDTVEGVTNIVEGMYRNIAATPAPFGQAPEGRARGIAGLVHATVRGVVGSAVAYDLKGAKTKYSHLQALAQPDDPRRPDDCFHAPWIELTPRIDYLRELDTYQ